MKIHLVRLPVVNCSVTATDKCATVGEIPKKVKTRLHNTS